MYATKDMSTIFQDLCTIGQHKWRVSIEKYRWTKEPFEDFMELVYYYTSNEEEDCINHLTEDILWDGKSFYQLEKALTWIDW